MPQFIINNTKPRHYGPNHDFVAGYIEAMYFTNGDTGSDNDDLLNELGTSRLTREALADIKADCDRFIGTIMPDGCFARQWLDRVEDYDDEQAGRDLWFTRQGHGVGYWEREQLKGYIGEGLTDAAKRLGEANVEVWRGWIYHR